MITGLPLFDSAIRRTVSAPVVSASPVVLTDDDARRIESNTERVLEMLRIRPRTSSELCAVTHRFSACIGALRKLRGYVIAGEKLEGGDYVWTLQGEDGTVEVTDEMKAAYYETPHWITTRMQRRELDHYKCVQCVEQVGIEVHHWRYELFAEQMRDLATLCRDCHVRIHENELIKVHFPHRVTREIAEQLR
jgi:DNA-directed RNA polymerase subunit RPC12/RpoP